ncbi:MAG: type II toxin-antitoxin system VapC family toxin [Pyrinomonadaceae bacterium]
MANRPIFDTNIFIKYRRRIEPVLVSVCIPSIVFFELLASSVDHSELKTLTRWRSTLKEIDQVLSPTESDFWETGKCINRLYLRKAAQESKLKTLRMDALIARLAVKSKNFIVTADTDDFEIIKKDMKQLVIVPAKDFFGQ